MNVPFVDLRSEYLSIQGEIDEALHQTIHDFNFIKGPPVAAFEKQFGTTLGITHCIGVGNGTDALLLCIKALGIQPGDEVITPAFSWISSAEIISMCGATPVFCDVDPETYVVTPRLLEKWIGPRTKAIIVVHLFGQAAPVREIKALCQRHNLFMIEDCAQAHFSKDGDQFTGSVGDASAFSFYPTKNLGAYGDAGCVVTMSDPLAEKIRRLANHGALIKDDHAFEGLNSRMDSIQGAVLLVKLRYLEKWNKRRNEIAALYRNGLKDVDDLILPFVRRDSEHTFHLFVVRTKKRDALKAYLDSKGVQTLVHYPKALPELDAYAQKAYLAEQFSTSCQLSKEVLSLPVHPGLSTVQIMYVIEKIKEFYRI